MVKISRSLIECGRSKHGGWSRAQLGLLGIEWPPESGWIKSVIGKEISEDVAKSFIDLRDSHLKSTY